ncbi:MAG: diaminopimelate epimerase [Melioribacteraceae bacterium]|nr:diaminopimelate epimerase [Melioribacteraceae bacterium]
MKKIIFSKFTAAGNDFVLLDESLNPELKNNTQLALILCDRNFGIGADGLLIYSEISNDEILIKYLNSDGSSGSLCGNGSRCAAEYYFEKRARECGSVKIHNLGIEYSAEKLENNFVKFGSFRIKILNDNIEIEENLFKLNGIWLDTGSPHFVTDFDEIYFSEKKTNFFEFDFASTAVKIRHNKNFSDSGTNVIFIQQHGDEFLIRSFERGVESETLSCGSGTVAAAIFCALKRNKKSPVNFRTIKDYNLSVEFKNVNHNFESVFLKGPAKRLFDGEFFYKK